MADASCDRLVHNAHRLELGVENTSVVTQVIGLPESVIGLVRNGCPDR